MLVSCVRSGQNFGWFLSGICSDCGPTGVATTPRDFDCALEQTSAMLEKYTVDIPVWLSNGHRGAALFVPAVTQPRIAPSGATLMIETPNVH